MLLCFTFLTKHTFPLFLCSLFLQENTNLHRQCRVKIPAIMPHRKPNRRLLAVRRKLGYQPAAPGRMCHRVRPGCCRRQRRPDLRCHRLLRPRRGQPNSGHSPARGDPNRTHLDHILSQYANQAQTRAHRQ